MQQVSVGTGEFRYSIAESWAKLPDGWSFGDVAAVAVDARDDVFVFNRGAHPMMVFDRDGQFSAVLGRGVCSSGRTGCMSAPTACSTAPMTATIRCANARPTGRFC